MGIFAFRGTHPIRAIHTADGGTSMPAATKRLRGLGMPEKPSRPNSLTAMEAQSDEPSASHEPARPMPQRKTHDAKPTLAELAGVRPTDKPDEGERPKRDRPRLAFRPFHAFMAILTLSCALCASLTMLVQQRSTTANCSIRGRRYAHRTNSSRNRPRKRNKRRHRKKTGRRRTRPHRTAITGKTERSNRTSLTSTPQT